MNASASNWMLRARQIAFVIGVAGLMACAIGRVVAPKEFFVSYLFGLLVWLGVALGSSGFLMIHHLTGGRWGYPIRRMFEAAMGTTSLVAILFIPILFGLDQLYPWADPVKIAGNEILQHKTSYLNTPAFVVRAAIVFAIWILLAYYLRRWSSEQDVVASPEPTKKLRRLSGPGLVIYPLTITFAYVDWIMSMEADWYSTVFPLLICIGQMLSALAFVVVMLAWRGEHSELNELIGKENFQQLGNLLLAFTMMWAYLAYSQLIIIWSGDLPHEIVWYLRRIAGGWRWIAMILLLFHFFGPFLFLLFRSAKRKPGWLLGIALIIFVTHIVDVWWLVAPSIYTTGFHVTWLAPVALIGIGGMWLGFFFRNLSGTPLIPLNDPRFAVAVSP